MDAKIKADWIAALRSGEYEQGTRRLRSTDDTYCCLGVLCDILGVDWQYYSAFNEYHALGESAFLPTEYLDLCDIDREDGYRVLWDLVALNDGDEPFSVIAREIERRL